MKLHINLLIAKLAAIVVFSLTASSLFSQPINCTPIDYKIFSITEIFILTQCPANEIANISGAVQIVNKKTAGSALAGRFRADAVDSSWLHLQLDSGALMGSAQYTVKYAGDETLDKFSLDIDTSFVFSVAPFNVPEDSKWFFTSHVAIKGADSGNVSCNLPELTVTDPTVENAWIQPSCQSGQKRDQIETIGVLIVKTGRQITKPVAIKTLKGIKSIFEEDPKVDPKSRLSAPKAPASKDASNYYINFSDLAGTGSSPSWVLDGKVSPPIGSLVNGFQISPLFTASVGQGSIPNITYSDNVNLGVQGHRDFFPPSSSASGEDSWVFGLTPGFTYATDKEFDRDSILGVLDLGVNPPGSYNTVGRQVQMAFLKKLSDMPLADRANLSIDDIDLPLIGYDYDLHFITEDGGSPIDTTVKASKGTATMTLPSYGIGRAGVMLHGLFQVTDTKSPIKFGMLSAEITGRGRYLIATEDTVLQRTNNSLYLESLNGWKGYAKLIVSWAPDRSGHFALSGTYTNGFDAPKYNRVNSVLLGITMKY